MPQLDCHRVQFYSQADEAAFFRFAQSIDGVKDVRGSGDSIMLNVSAEPIYGVEGVVTFTVEGKPVDIGPGETCFIRRGGFMVSTTSGKRMSKRWPSLLRGCSARISSKRRLQS